MKINRSCTSASSGAATPSAAVVRSGSACQRRFLITHWASSAKTLILSRVPTGDKKRSQSVHQIGTAGCRYTPKTHTHINHRKINQYLLQKTIHLSPTNTYYLKSAFHSDEHPGITLTLIASQKKIAPFFLPVYLLFNCCCCCYLCGPEMSSVNQGLGHALSPRFKKTLLMYTKWQLLHFIFSDNNCPPLEKLANGSA